MSNRWELGLRVLLATASCTLLFCDAAAEVERTFPAKGAAPTPLGGTLFFARGEREQMDRARKGGVPAPSPEDLSTVRKSSAINGFVKRSDGVTSVWVDEQVRHNVDPTIAEQLEPMSVGAPPKFNRASQPKDAERASAPRQTRFVKHRAPKQSSKIVALKPR
jgi:hypothetical protein